MSAPTPAREDIELGRHVVAKVARRLIPFMMLLYFVNYLDRTNIGFAELQMSEDLNLTATAYGLASGLFFIGYLFFEVPSNLALHRFGARRWIARIMITWGIIASAMAFVPNAETLYALRVLLGVAEAGFFPGMILFLTYWFPRRERARAGSGRGSPRCSSPRSPCPRRSGRPSPARSWSTPTGCSGSRGGG